MARNGTWLLAILAIVEAATADDALLKRWDAPRRETFALKKMPAREAAMEVRQRFGYEFEFDRETVTEIAFKATNATFFEALDRLGAAVGLYLVGVPAPDPQQALSQGKLALVRPTTPLAAPVVAYLGPTRLSVESVSVLAVERCAPEPEPTVPGVPGELAGLIPGEILRALKTHTPEAQETPRLRLRIKWITEPGLEELLLTGLTLGEAMDDLGKRIPRQEGQRFPVAANEVFPLDFDPPSGKAKLIKKLQGNARVGVPVERGEITFVAAEANVTKTLGRAFVTLEGMDAVPPTIRLVLVGTPTGFSREEVVPIEIGESGGRWAGEPPALTITAYDALGGEIKDGHMRESRSEPQSKRCTYNFHLERAPARIVLRAITSIEVREVPFVLNNIPLPQ